ncbi:MAG: hypothetical protein Q9201_001315 [Fulgogasparrea decipioides]
MATDNKEVSNGKETSVGEEHWLMDLADYVPREWNLHGFDIDGKNFPAKEYLPENLSFSIHDAFDEPPPELTQRFDVVHFRALTLIVKGGDPNHLFSNIIKMLKPGGYLQCDEADPHRLRAIAPNPAVSTHYTDKLISTWLGIASALGLEHSWTANIGPILRDKHHLEVLAAQRYGPVNKVRKPATDIWCMSMDMMCCNVARRGGKGAELVQPDLYIEMMKGVADEVARGVTIWLDFTVVVAYKPVPRVGQLYKL